jgi:hypothetical protein
MDDLMKFLYCKLMTVLIVEVIYKFVHKCKLSTEEFSLERNGS